MTDDEMHADLEVAPLNIWMGEPETGRWCNACQLPSAIRIPLDLDPAQPDGSYVDFCPECHPSAEEAS